jgi:hypothetical protein
MSRLGTIVFATKVVVSLGDICDSMQFISFMKTEKVLSYFTKIHDNLMFNSYA